MTRDEFRALEQRIMVTVCDTWSDGVSSRQGRIEEKDAEKLFGFIRKVMNWDKRNELNPGPRQPGDTVQ